MSQIAVKAIYMTPSPEVLRCIFSSLLATKNQKGGREDIRLREITTGTAYKNFTLDDHYNQVKVDGWHLNDAKWHFWSPLNGISANYDMKGSLGAILARKGDHSVRGMCIHIKLSRFKYREDGAAVGREYMDFYHVMVIPPSENEVQPELYLTPEEDYIFANGPLFH